MKYIFFLSLPFYVLDRISKYWVLHYIDPDNPRRIIPNFFTLVIITNTGAAFGSFNNNHAFCGGRSRLAALLALVLLVVHRRPTQSDEMKSVWWTPNAWRDVSLAVLLGGVLCTVTD